MTHKKQKVKAGRRARKHQDRAWEAVENDNLDLATKEIRRALGERKDNPQIWLDCGLILGMQGELHEAEKALRDAILIAPTYGEAHAALAEVLARRGRTIQAERMQNRAVELCPGDEEYSRQLELYRSLLPAEADVRSEQREQPDDEPVRLDHRDWGNIEEQLQEQGFALLPALLSSDRCEQLMGLFADGRRFERTVELKGSAGHGGSYRFFRKPLPRPVAELRTLVYARAAPIVNRWMELLSRGKRYPESHAAFLARCREAGQHRSPVILIHYRAPAVNELHRDVWGELTFPLQLAVTLSGRDGISGGEFVLADQGPGKGAQRHEIATDRGD